MSREWRVFPFAFLLFAFAFAPTGRAWAQRFSGEPILLFSLVPQEDALREDADTHTNMFLAALSLRGAQPLWYDPEHPAILRAIQEGSLTIDDLKFDAVDAKIARRFLTALGYAAAVYGSLSRVEGKLVVHLAVIEATSLRLGKVDVRETDQGLANACATAVYNEVKRLKALPPLAPGEQEPAGSPPQGMAGPPPEAVSPPSETASPPPGAEAAAQPPEAAAPGATDGGPEAAAGTPDLFQHGMDLAAAGDVEAAAQAFEAALRDNPNNVRILVELAKVYHRIGRFSDAQRVLEQASTIDPANPEIRRMLDLYRQTPGSPSPTTTDLVNLRALAERQPDNPEVIRALAQAYAARGDYNGAVRAYEALARLLPADASVQRELGKAYAHTGETEKAIRALSQAVLWEPKDGEARMALAAAYAGANRFDEALEQYAAASETWREDQTLDAETTKQVMAAVQRTVPQVLGDLEVVVHGAIARITADSGSGTEVPSREELFRHVTELLGRAQKATDLLTRVQPPDDSADSVDQWLLTSSLASQSCSNLRSALDASDVEALRRAIWCYNQATGEAKRALEMGSQG